MIIKSHIRAGYRSAAAYLKAIGKNEKTRLVQMSDPDARHLDEAFHNMWTVASNTKAKKPLHHISINPQKDERLTDAQVQRIVKRCGEKYGYVEGDHQYVVVEHIKDGRQHFHVFWNRVSLETGKAVWPGHHWNKSKQVAREMEKELGLKRPVPRRQRNAIVKASYVLEGAEDEPQVTTSRKRKGGKGGGVDGSGGGMNSGVSVFSSHKSSAPSLPEPTRPMVKAGNFVGNRRWHYVPVSVERRANRL